MLLFINDIPVRILKGSMPDEGQFNHIIDAAAEPLTVNAISLIMGRRSVAGWYSGTAMDSQETLQFSAQSGVHPMIETFPLERVAEAYERMTSGKARFRAVLTTGS